MPIDLTKPAEVERIVRSCLGTKVTSSWMDLAVRIAMGAVKTVETMENGRKEIDIKRYIRIEKIPGGAIEDSLLVRGVVLNKDVTHPKMRRRIENPRIVLLDCPLEYKKGESQVRSLLSIPRSSLRDASCVDEH